MGKVLALLFMILLAFASAAGYLFLSEKIIAGERQIADGQRRLENEQPALEEGKARLKVGKREMSKGKKDYEQAKGQPVLGVSGQAAERRKGLQGSKRTDRRRRKADCRRRGQD